VSAGIPCVRAWIRQGEELQTLVAKASHVGVQTYLKSETQQGMDSVLKCIPAFVQCAVPVSLKGAFGEQPGPPHYARNSGAGDVPAGPLLFILSSFFGSAAHPNPS
jgi:hypothetical protein